MRAFLLNGWLCCVLTAFGANESAFASDPIVAARRFHQQVQPVLEAHCYGCHGNGSREGGHAFDEYKSDQELIGDTKRWLAVLKNVRSGVMPPADEERLTADERQRLFDWIERDAFGVDSTAPDPGRLTLRRLNRVEYRNTVRDLTGVDFDTTVEFPPDDAGYGFDNIGDAMSVSPLLMEKYFAAARTVAAQASANLLAKKDGLDATQRDQALRELFAKFVRRAYRRPADDRTVERLVALVNETCSSPEQSVESGVGVALTAVLASPRFLFRVDEPVADATDVSRGSASDASAAHKSDPSSVAGKPPANTMSHALVDEFSLASHLSYFLWSTMPDDELLTLAERGELRKKLQGQVDRMLKDVRSAALAENFSGQWLRARDIEHVDINPLAVFGLQQEFQKAERDIQRLRREREQQVANKKKPPGEKNDDPQNAAEQERQRIRTEYRRLQAVRAMFDSELRRAMRDETTRYFDFVMRENRDVLELVTSNYTFLNARLAKHYGIEGVDGDAMRRVELPAGNVRGGVLTQATLLMVTSNPGRTSPVKRGLYLLNNVLGFPPSPPPPPNVPPLEASQAITDGRQPTVREMQERHRRDPLCRSCHARMDPLGLAFENFNALGMWRDQENGGPIDASGTLITGEEFTGIQDLKRIIASQHRLEFYRCLAEKLLTYAVGRGLEYYDEVTVDQIVERMDREQGKSSALLMGIIESAPFQRMRVIKDSE